jgi:hypothetical protein
MEMIYMKELIKIEIPKNENAIHLYEKMGFKVKNIAYSMMIK